MYTPLPPAWTHFLRSLSSLLRRKLKRTGHCPFLSLSLTLPYLHCYVLSLLSLLTPCSLLASGHSPVCVSCFTCCSCPCWLWHTLQKAKPSKQRGMSTMEGEWDWGWTRLCVVCVWFKEPTAELNLINCQNESLKEMGKISWTKNSKRSNGN